MIYLVDYETEKNKINNILESAKYINFPLLTFESVSLIESTLFDKKVNIVNYIDLINLCEEYSQDINSCLTILSETHNIDIDSICVSVNEADLILDQEIYDYIPNIIVKPISENNIAYKFCNLMVESYIETGNEDYLNILLDEDNFYLVEGTVIPSCILNELSVSDVTNQIKSTFNSVKQHGSSALTTLSNKGAEYSQQVANQIGKAANYLGNTAAGQWVGGKAKQFDDWAVMNHTVAAPYNKLKAGANKALDWAKENPGKTMAGAAGVMAVAALVKSAIGGDPQKIAEGKDPSWISQKIASLRNIYKQWLQKAQQAVNAQQASTFQQVAAKILEVVDSLMAKLQQMTA